MIKGIEYLKGIYFGSAFDPITKNHKSIINWISYFVKCPLVVGVLDIPQYKKCEESIGNRLSILSSANLNCTTSSDLCVVQTTPTYEFLKSGKVKLKIDTIAIGVDEYLNIQSWKNYEELTSEYLFLVFDKDSVCLFNKSGLIKSYVNLNPLSNERSSTARELLHLYQITVSPQKNRLTSIMDYKDLNTILRNSYYSQRGQNLLQKEEMFLDKYVDDVKMYDKFNGNTVDVMLFSKGLREIILIKRNGFPNRYLWAFPGGFVNTDEKQIRWAAVREVEEETGIVLDKDKLKIFDTVITHDPRKKIITTIYSIELSLTRSQIEENIKNKFIEGRDDASAGIGVFDIYCLPSMTDDHYSYLQTFLSK